MDEEELAELTAKKPLREGWKRSELKARKAPEPGKPGPAAPKSGAPGEPRPSRPAEKKPPRGEDWGAGPADLKDQPELAGMFDDLGVNPDDPDAADDGLDVDDETWAVQEERKLANEDVSRSANGNQALSSLVEELKNRKRAVEAGERPSGRRTRCPQHGLEYDPTQSSGCPKCTPSIGLGKLAVNRKLVIAAAAMFGLGLLYLLSGGEESNPRVSKEVPASVDADFADTPADSDDKSFATQPSGSPESDRQILEGLKKVTLAAEQLLSEGQAELEALRGAEASDGPDAAAEVNARWTAWASSWQERLSALRATLPAQPGGNSDMNLILGFGELETALDEVGRVAAPGINSSVPTREERRVRFKTAGDALRGASQDLAKVRTPG